MLRLQERASRTPELPGPLSGPWTPAERDFALRARDVRFAHIISALQIFQALEPFATGIPGIRNESRLRERNLVLSSTI